MEFQNKAKKPIHLRQCQKVETNYEFYIKNYVFLHDNVLFINELWSKFIMISRWTHIIFKLMYAQRLNSNVFSNTETDVIYKVQACAQNNCDKSL